MLSAGENRYGVFVHKESEAKAREVNCRRNLLDLIRLIASKRAIANIYHNFVFCKNKNKKFLLVPKSLIKLEQVAG